MKLQDQVQTLLVQYPYTRDSDELLVYMYVQDYVKSFHAPTMSFRDYLEAVKSNEIPSWSSIVRHRRRVQEEHPLLRGTSYQGRKAAQKDFRKRYSHAS